MFEMGLIQTIVGGFMALCTAVLVAFLNHRWRSKGEKAAPSPKEPPLERNCTPPQLEFQIPYPAKKRTNNPALSHKIITEAIEAVPPFQQKGVEESFHGIRVSWRAKLFGIDRNGGDELTVTVLLEDDHRTMVFCTAMIEDCEGLTHAPTNSPVHVTGDIKRISPYESVLENCHIMSLSA